MDLLAQLAEHIRSRRFGKYRGTVVSNQDKTNRGRLKVSVPSVLGSLEVWAMPCIPYAGKNVGLFAMPPEKSGVWVEFEGGDTSFPIWTGCFWADDEAPLGGSPDIKVWKTDTLTLSLDDKEDEATLKNGSNASMTMNKSVETVAAQAKHTVSSDGVVAELGSGKVEVATGGVSVNNGAFEVH
ncbi:MAG: baseplate assembly protein [Kofleriaceae bacterium]|nr:baseplate assembly protein [Kofleriaceae bacterium]